MENFKTQSKSCCGSEAHARPSLGLRRKAMHPLWAIALWMLIILSSGLAATVAGQSIPCELFDTAGTAGKYRELIPLSNGDFLACGDMPDGQGFLERFDPQMRHIWRRGYQFGTRPTKLYDVVENSQGELVAAGSCQDWTPGMPRRGMLLYVDANGAMLSSTPIFVSSDSGEIWAIDNALDGNGYIVAERYNIPWFQESWVRLVDDAFSVTWSTQCDGYGQFTHLHDITAVPGLGYFASGITGNAFHDNRLNYWSLDSTGGIIWGREYVTDTVDKPHLGYSLAWDGSSNTLILGGTVYIDSVAGNDYCLFRIDPWTGALLDSAFGGFGAGKDDHMLKVRVDANGLIYGAGYTSGGYWFGLTTSDASVITFDTNLDTVSTRHWEDSNYVHDAWVIEGLALDPQGLGCYNWAGHRSGTRNGGTYFGSCSMPCIVSMEDPTEIDFSLFPNPPVSGSTVRLRWEEALRTDGDLEVFGMDGRLVHTQAVGAGENETNFSAPDVAGIYLVRIHAGSQVTTKRLMVMHL